MGGRTASREKMGPSATFFTMKELDFCENFAAVSDGSAEQHEHNATHAEKEPLKVGGHLDGLAIVHLGVADE